MITSDLELFHGRGDTLADRLTAVAQADVLQELVGDYKAEARTALEDVIRELTEQTGTAFTARMGRTKALVTDPQPKPRIVDEERFAAWAYDHAPYDVTVVDVLVVHAEASAANIIIDMQAYADDLPKLQSLIAELHAAIEPAVRYVLPHDPLAPLTKLDRYEPHGEFLIDMDTGEPVPGVACSTAQSRLQVTVDKAEKRVAKAALVEALNLPALETSE